MSPAAVARALAAVALLLLVAHLGGQFSKLALGHGGLKGLVPLFDMSSERNIPAYFSVLLMLLAALLLGAIAVLSHKASGRHATKWAVLSVGFVCMAFDEAFSVHERLMVPLRALLAETSWVTRVNGEVVLGVLYFAWVVPGTAIVVLLGLYFPRFLLELPAASRWRFLLAAALYLAGAIGFELIGGRYAERHGFNNWPYTIVTTLEESLEIAGLIVFIWALLKYCEETYRRVRFGFGA